MGKYDFSWWQFINDELFKSKLQEYLDDIDDRLNALEGSSGDNIGNRLERIEKMHQINVMISGTHCHSGWGPKPKQ